MTQLLILHELAAKLSTPRKVTILPILRGSSRVRPRRRSTPTDEGAAGRADFAGRTGRDDFDPTRPLPVEQPARFFDSIVTTPAESRVAIG